MNRIVCFLLLFSFTACVVSCGIMKNTERVEKEENDVLNSTNTISRQNKGESELKESTEKSETNAGMSFDYGTIVIDDEYFEKHPDIGAAIVKIKPVEYSFFTYITESGERNNEKKPAELSADIEEVLTRRGNIDLNAGRNITLTQYLYIYPSAEYWNDFTAIYGGDDKTLESVPSGLYKHDNAKLDELGIYQISTFDNTPLLQCGGSYYAYVSARKTETGTEYYSNLYCDENYNPIIIGDNGEKNYSTLSSAGVFSEEASRFAEEVRTIKQ